MEPDQALSPIGGRRFFITAAVALACTVLVWFVKITPEIFRDVIIATVAVYIGGNTYQKVKNSAGPSA